MAYNALRQEVPIQVEEAARQHACLAGVQYVYREGEYGGRFPVASIGCRKATPFRSPNHENFKVPLGDGWVAFRSPSYASSQPLAAAEPDTNGGYDETLDALLRLTDPNSYSPQADDWVPQAAPRIEDAIDSLVAEFAHTPYLHRVEHSLHVRLCALLTEHPDGAFSGRHPIGERLATTQLVHKEWPETFARPEKNGRRGNFDIVVLSPSLLASCPTLEDFRQGRLAAPFAIEMGVDYDVHHLAKDARKLINSRPYRGYLIHLTRDLPRDPDVEQIVLNLEQKTGIRTAYVCLSNMGCVHKLVSASKIVEGLPADRT